MNKAEIVIISQRAETKGHKMLNELKKNKGTQ